MKLFGKEDEQSGDVQIVHVEFDGVEDAEVRDRGVKEVLLMYNPMGKSTSSGGGSMRSVFADGGKV